MGFKTVFRPFRNFTVFLGSYVLQQKSELKISSGAAFSSTIPTAGGGGLWDFGDQPREKNLLKIDVHLAQTSGNTVQGIVR